MQGNRQDAWTKEEDILLAETVLHHIREGKTQLEAFKEAGNKLSRTSAACGFRWNATLRKHYEDAIQVAKNNRKKITYNREVVAGEQDVNFQEIIKSIEKISNYYQSIDQTKRMNDLEEENKQLREHLQLYKSIISECIVILKKADHIMD
ncbi:RsfA family transcriptional regulator [Gracilibacillus marinus]|uniref:RsfA family transcriptional regulator n=1 Tax=Gracilibacillus marinus TaxID=630535 RepID=A0ABV8VUD9_9BACI